MGFGLPAAIGAKMARPDKEVWAIVGDGGFQMTQAELQTMVQENVKVNVAIINNGYLGHGAAVAAVLPRSPLLRHADVVARLREAGRRARPAGRSRDQARRHGGCAAHARASAGAVVMDFRVEQEDTVYPMVSPGAALERHDQAARLAVARRRRERTCNDRRAKPRTIVVRYEHEIDALDRVAGILRRQRVRAEAFTAVASHDRATVQATIMFDSSDKTAARIVSLLGNKSASWQLKTGPSMA